MSWYAWFTVYFKMPISSFYYYIQAGQIIPSIPSHSRVSRRHQLLSPNPLPLFNSPSPATAQKPVNFISHICGLGASVGCERVERTFNAPRLKSQICLIGGNGFVCSSLNELNSKSIFCFEFIHIFCFSDYNNDIPGLEMVIWQDFDVCLVFIFDSDNV